MSVVPWTSEAKRVVQAFEDGHIYAKRRKGWVTLYAVRIGMWENHGVPFPDIRWLQLRDDLPSMPVVGLRFVFVWEPDYERIYGIKRREWEATVARAIWAGWPDDSIRKLVSVEADLQKRKWLGRDFCTLFARNYHHEDYERRCEQQDAKEWEKFKARGRNRRPDRSQKTDEQEEWEENKYWCDRLGLWLPSGHGWRS